MKYRLIFLPFAEPESMWILWTTDMEKFVKTDRALCITVIGTETTQILHSLAAGIARKYLDWENREHYPNIPSTPFTAWDHGKIMPECFSGFFMSHGTERYWLNTNTNIIRSLKNYLNIIRGKYSNN